MISLARHLIARVRRFRDRFRRTVPGFKLYLSCVQGKRGIEIGGPSVAFRPHNVMPVYAQAGSLDNCDFSSTTVWADHRGEFTYLPGRPAGRAFFCEGSDLAPVAPATYDFVLSSHNLEHFANPLKALHEWKRVLKPGGALILLLPFYRNTFDRFRTPTPVSNMVEDFERNVGEDDLSHLAEILDKHDLSRDVPAGSREDFRKRSLDNLHNRCLHHHVFDERNSRDLLTAAGYEVADVEIVEPNHICLLARV